MFSGATLWKTVLIFFTLLPFVILFSILTAEKTEQVQTRIAPASSSMRQLLSENLSSISSPAAAGKEGIGWSEHPQLCLVLLLQYLCILGISKHTKNLFYSWFGLPWKANLSMTKNSKFKKTCSDTTLQAPEAECTKKINQVNRDKEYLRGWGPTEPKRCNTDKLFFKYMYMHTVATKIALILITGNRDGNTPRFAFTLLQTSDKT